MNNNISCLDFKKSIDDVYDEYYIVHDNGRIFRCWFCNKKYCDSCLKLDKFAETINRIVCGKCRTERETNPINIVFYDMELDQY